MRYDLHKIVIVGAGVAGQGVMELAESKNIKAEFYVNKFSLRNADLAVVSPGIPLDHEIFSYCRNDNIPVIGEIEFGYCFNDKPIIAVTGTNGKTTTVELLNKIFEKAGIAAAKCGNIGISFCSEVAKGDFDVVLLEISSFQLETIVDFCPDIGIILNIGEDHLNRHITRKNYADAKLNIAKNMGIHNKLLLGGEIECGLLKEFTPKCELFYIGAEHSSGIYLSEENSVVFDNREICKRDDIKMQGEHNLHNAMAAIAASKLYGISDDIIRQTLREFEPPRHRIEYVDTIDGKKFYNDSKGTNIDATLAAIKSVSGNICLLLGGSDKGEDFKRLFREMGSEVTSVVAMGNIKYKIFSAAKDCGFENIELGEDLEESLHIALKKDCDTILFSPAAASFDKYNGYAQRGEHFISLVKEMKK